MNVETARQRHAPTLMDLAKAGMLYFPENEKKHRKLEAKRKREVRKAKKRRARRRGRKLEREVERCRQYLRYSEMKYSSAADITDPFQGPASVASQTISSPSHMTNDSDSSPEPSSERPRSEPHDIPFLEFFPELAPFWQSSTPLDAAEAMTDGNDYDVDIVAPEHDDSFVHWLGETACQSFGNDAFWGDLKNPAFEMTEKMRKYSFEDIRFWHKPPSQRDIVLEACPEFAALWQEVPHRGCPVNSVTESGVAMGSSLAEVPTTQSIPTHSPDYIPPATSFAEGNHIPQHNIFGIQDDLELVFGSDDICIQTWKEYVESQLGHYDHSSFDTAQDSDQVGTDTMLEWLLNEAIDEQEA
ncbi:hypothetical protein NW762_008844 [Fusarium torreyae]|uniref:Uncharacterized protein n=1 Tax=Fusarium torreyae TaxID=1237075 RepID=A0A9W8RUN6_9HYPO|nr:hypothetical protein NW762_008844 [Fusarium torreyae]